MMEKEKIEKIFLLAFAHIQDAQLSFKKDMKVPHVTQVIDVAMPAFVEDVKDYLKE